MDLRGLWAASTRPGLLDRSDGRRDLERCEADLAPGDGRPVEYRVEASFRESSIEGLPPSVDVDLSYRHPDATL